MTFFVIKSCTSEEGYSVRFFKGSGSRRKNAHVNIVIVKKRFKKNIFEKCFLKFFLFLFKLETPLPHHNLSIQTFKYYRHGK